MKNLFLPFFILLAAVVTAQDARVKNFYRFSASDPTYLRFRTQLDSLTRTLRGSNGNFAAAKSIFGRNQAILIGLQQRAGLPPARAMSGRLPNRTRQINSPKGFLADPKFIALPPQVLTVVNPPYIGRFTRWQYKLGKPTFTEQNDLNAGKLVLKSTSSWNEATRELGVYNTGFSHTIKMSSDPNVIAAKITFEYSFNYNGWDTYGAVTGVDLMVRIEDEEFNSPGFKALPDAPIYKDVPSLNLAPLPDWKVVGTLMQMDSVTADIEEIHASVNSSFTMEGYITPNKMLHFNIGFGFPPGATKGLNGTYHYGEFILKKITIQYFKSVK